MKLDLKIWVPFVVITVLLSSCQQELEDFEPPVVITADSNYLYKIYHKDSVGGTAMLLGSYTYEYDATGRVKSFTDSTSTNIRQYCQYYYHGNDTLPYSSLSYDSFVWSPSSPIGTDTINTYFSYDASGRRVRDSAIAKYLITFTPPDLFDTFTIVKTYQYAGNFIYGDEVRKNTAGIIAYHYRDTAQTDGNENVISSKRYDFLSGATSPEREYILTYDNKPCSYVKPSNFRTLPIFPTNIYFGELQSKNNKLKVTAIYSGATNVNDFTGGYIYNSRNYPSRITSAYSPGGYEVFDFYYKDF